MARSTKKKTFTIPKNFVLRFFQELEDNSLEHELIEVDEDGDLCVEVEYTPDERDLMMDLVELESEFYESEETEEEN